MGKKGKGKERRDHYYQLAKLQGYRARSAFKLIHLAQKHNIFGKCQSLLDLCAAPGGWLQVAKQNMPMSSVIVGVDLAPIRPIRGCTTIQADITTARCRVLLKKELTAGNVDVVLHDGSPNVGTNWVHDAYVQNELALHAAKLACEFLKPGGMFISKVFRSQDYGSLIWLFNQLFEKVNATKPQSSRGESAEIFVVCSHFLAPSKIDPRFFDPKFAFLSVEGGGSTGLVDPSGSTVLDVDGQDSSSGVADGSTLQQKTSVKEILRARGKRNRGGYEEGDDFSTCSAMVFFNASNPADIITRHNKLTFPSPECDKIIENPRTDEEVLAICQDLKVCGRRELTSLMRWRFRVMRDWAAEKKKEDNDLTGTSEFGGEQKELPAADGMEFDEEGAEKELERLVDEEAVMRLKAERKRKAKERKLEWRRKLTSGAFPEGDEVPDLFRKDIHGEILEKQDELGVDATELFDSEDENDVAIHVPMETYTTKFGGQESTDHLAAMEMDLDFDHKMRKLRTAKRNQAPANVRDVGLTRRKRVELERSEELKKFEADLTARARELMSAKRAAEEKDSDSDDDDDDEDEEKKEEGDESDEEDGVSEERTSRRREQSDGVEINGSEDDDDDDLDEDEEVLSRDGDDDDDEEEAMKEAARLAQLKKKKGGFGKKGENSEDAAAQEEKMKKLKAARWFASHPLFASIATADKAKEDGRAGRKENRIERNGVQQKGKGEGEGLDDSDNDGGDVKQETRDDVKESTVTSSRKRGKSGIDDDISEGEEFALLPLCDKKRKQLKRKKDQARQEAKRRRKEKTEGDLSALGAKDELFERTPFEEVSAAETMAQPKAPKDPNELAKVQAIGSLLIRKNSRMDLIDSAYNRYAFNDEDCLPVWFREEEAKHNKPEVPLPKDLELEFRKKLREIQERPIRKVLEAKFRRKKRADQRIARVNRQANIVANSPDMTEATRLQSIRRIVGKAKREDQRPKKYLVSRSAGGARTLRRDAKAPKNAQIKVVDRRMKKDKRAMKKQKKGGARKSR